ncbi:hypothetical protein REPUB_Repub03eG0217300 [Reevesia pubescens]
MERPIYPHFPFSLNSPLKSTNQQHTKTQKPETHRRHHRAARIPNLKIKHAPPLLKSIIRNCRFRTGLFTSPHLINVRDRFRVDGVEISEEKFLEYFWWCYDKLKENTNDDVPMPTYFRFLALLAFKIFAAEQVRTPIVCGISSLGYDHMEIFELLPCDLEVTGSSRGNSLLQKCKGRLRTIGPKWPDPSPDPRIAGASYTGKYSGRNCRGEGCMGFQPLRYLNLMRQCMCLKSVLEEKAPKLNVHSQVAHPLYASLLNGLKLALEGEHQYLNAGLAVALCSTWLQRTGHPLANLNLTGSLPEQFFKGLTTASLQGRAQIVRDQFTDIENPGDLVFYLDGAHSPESMEACAKWFSLCIKEDNQQSNLNHPAKDYTESSNDVA